MTKLHARSLALYRTYLRGVRDVSGKDESKLMNLRRAMNPQWRQVIKQASTTENPQVSLEELVNTVASSLALLQSSKSLTKNLASLSYHHHPFHLPSTSNSSRLYSHTPRPIEWDPQDPSKAMKSYEKRKKDREEKGEGKLGELADLGLRGVRNRAERRLGVALGRWEYER
ncbi:hypothetical protein JCM16303_001389 [Sporobolomyces ruberrimus]